ncbi:hypothetical protein [Kordiimonas sp.]|uniref:hypothetical protein n=1 Tax=Kordiimonas sp. TaxID=1970157 RepID=UPI003A8D9532
MKRPRVIDLATLEESQTGRALDPASWEKAQAERLTLELQSEGIASRLERCGVRVRQGSFTMIGLLTENHIEKTAFRNCNIIPTCQSRNTHDMMKAVQYWMDTTGAKKTRMWVLSKGWVPLYEYSKHHKEFTRTISKLNSNPVLKKYGVEFVYYAVENTIKLKDHGPGVKVPMMNLHAHVLLKANQFAGKEGWQMMLDEVRRFVPKGYLHDSPIKKAAEVVKYVFKPAEFERLNDDQFACLFNQTMGLRFHTCLGELREFRSGLKNDGLKLKRIEGEAQGEWRLVKSRKRDDRKDKPPSVDEAGNLVMGITSPSPTLSEVYEPYLLVKDFNGSLQALLAANPWIEQRMAALRRTADRQNARPSIKDTTTTTVQDCWLDHTVEWHQPPPDDEWMLV